jgi:hypothetical protein
MKKKEQSNEEMEKTVMDWEKLQRSVDQGALGSIEYC